MQGGSNHVGHEKDHGQDTCAYHLACYLEKSVGVQKCVAAGNAFAREAMILVCSQVLWWQNYWLLHTL